MDGQAQGATQFAMLEQVRAYWSALAQDGMPPLRAVIDPRGIAEALEFCFVAERRPSGTVTFRIAGMGLADIAGVDLSGVPVLSPFDGPARDRVARTLQAVFDGPATADLWLEGLRGPGQPALEARMLLLPLRAADGQVRMVLGCLAAVGEVGRPPRRFALARRVVMPMGTPAAAPAFAEPAADYAPAAERRPLLRVVRAAS
jgi:hypothetical protein